MTTDETIDELVAEFGRRRPALETQREALLAHLRGAVATDAHVDQITGRTKTVGSFAVKVAKRLADGALKYANPFVDMQDLIGLRIVVFYASDVERVREIVQRDFRPLEIAPKEPAEATEFDYFGLHYVLQCQDDFRASDDCVSAFELQIKTLWQHAWSQACHDLIYKPPCETTVDDRRRAALASASAWGNDRLLDELFREMHARAAARR